MKRRHCCGEETAANVCPVHGECASDELCVCPHPDAKECLVRRHPGLILHLSQEDKCECVCHSSHEDNDGY